MILAWDDAVSAAFHAEERGAAGVGAHNGAPCSSLGAKATVREMAAEVAVVVAGARAKRGRLKW